MNKLLGPALLAICLLFGACKKEVATAVTAEPEKVNKITIQNLDFQNFTSKAKIQYQGGGEDLSSPVTIRIKKGSIIWVSVVPGLGIEALRAKITPDSIYVVNRLQKEYFAGNYDFLKRRFNVDLTYNMIEGLLLGNYVPAAGSEKLMIEEPFQRIRTESGNLTVDHFIHTSDFKLKKSDITDGQSSQHITVTYNQFEPLADKLFAREALIVLINAAKGNTTVTLNHNKISLDEADLSFPFTIPDSYTPIKL